MKKSFYDWCIENNRQDLLDRWDYELNKKSPASVGCTSLGSWYFKCPKGEHESTPYKLANVTRHINSSVKCIKCNSFAFWGISNIGEDFLNKYWDYEKNKHIDPWKLPYGGREEIYIFCQEKPYHESYKTKPSHFVAGFRCPYCSSIYIHKLDSFGQWAINNVDKDFIQKYWGKSNTQDIFEVAEYANYFIHINCQDNDKHGEYLIRAYDFRMGVRCPFCAGRRVVLEESLGHVYDKYMHLLSEDNEVSPFDLTCGSSKRIKVKCHKGIHPDYEERVYRVVGRLFECPRCHEEAEESYLQKKVDSYIKEHYEYEYNREEDCSLRCFNPYTGHQLPYDGEIIVNDKRLILEVQGIQHYEICLLTKLDAKERGITPEESLRWQQYRDKVKKDYALSQGYHYLEIPYWTESDESYKTLIDDAIHKILNP